MDWFGLVVSGTLVLVCTVPWLVLRRHEKHEQRVLAAPSSNIDVRGPWRTLYNARWSTSPYDWATDIESGVVDLPRW
jgi:hypothetical protein